MIYVLGGASEKRKGEGLTKEREPWKWSLKRKMSTSPKGNLQMKKKDTS